MALSSVARLRAARGAGYGGGALQETVRGWKLSQKASADRLGLTQPRLNDLLRGKIDKFSLDALFDLTRRVGLKVSIALRKAS
jgi:predicted XRE-type DNA-binding protein